MVSMETMTAIIQEIDPSLTFLSSYMGSHREAIVKRAGVSGSFAIKYVNSSNRASKQTIERESAALVRALNISGINPLVQGYEIGGYQAILRKIMPGATTLEDSRAGLSEIQKRTLASTIEELHNFGIVDLGINEGNVITSPSGEVRIANSDMWATDEHYGPAKFDGSKKNDLDNLQLIA
jgi:hypothetical protein